MTVRRKKSWFFGPPGSAYKKFSKNNEPDEAMFKELFNSQTFPAELNDTAKTNEQGLSKIADDSKVMSMTDASFAAGEMTEMIVPHQMPEVYSDIEGGDAYDSRDTDDADVAPGDPGYNPTTYVGWGIQVEYLKRTIGSVFRRVYRVINTLSFIPTGFSILYTKCATGYETYIKPASSDGSLTITDNGNGDWDFVTVPGVGPAGEDSVEATKTGDITLRGSASGVVTDFSTAIVDLCVMQGDTKLDLTTFTAITSSPASNPATFEYVHSHPDNYTYRITQTSIAATVNNGKITVYFDVDGDPLHMVSIDIHITKINANYGLEYQGLIAVLPGSTTHLYWYKLPDGSSWFFDDPNHDGVGVWVQFSSGGGSSGPTKTTTIAAIGAAVPLTNTSESTHIIKSGSPTTLIGPVNFAAAGSFEDGHTFTFILQCNIVLNGQTFTLLGATSLTEAEAYFGRGVVIKIVYDGATASFIAYRESNIDSGWQICNGFTHMAAAIRPRYRILNNVIYFKGTAVIPLDDGGGSVVAYNSEIDYATVQLVAPYTGAGGVLTPDDKTLYFNAGSSLLPLTAALPLVTMNNPFVYATRKILTDTADTYAMYHTLVQLYISTDGVMMFKSLLDSEQPSAKMVGAVDFTGNSGLRRNISAATLGDTTLDYTKIVAGTLDGITVAGPHTLIVTDQGVGQLHQVTLDTSFATQLGGFEIGLNGLSIPLY